ncbi:hypothetical protein AXZ77_0641 [Thioclava sp. ES.031]|uniref:hypothetical protein n=1 Tax=Thioclava sp. ES.031 TaxID=1798203 RepID=UPI000BF49DEB|nr:hypothetical protein [Thioclava sp. ES.031]PFG62074.1 hypothetical protein AXZ77_0641 [Thioclava sp. ES.031]
MIQTRFLSGQGLGNQLWTYAAARGIAEHLGRPHVVTGRDVFKGAEFLDIDFGEDPEPDAPVARFNEALFYDPELKYFSSSYDIRTEHLPPRVQLDGLFQSERYFHGREMELKNWIRPNASVLSAAERYRDVGVLNLRGGEYKRHKALILPRSYWDMAVDLLRRKVGATEILVVTDDPSYARAFLPEFPVLEGGVAECYAALMGAKALAVSNSSFSYFPIKTRGDRPFVIAPEHWARYGHPARRWAMPANLYRDWHWLSPTGELRSHKECRDAAEADANWYEAEFSVRIPPSMGIGLPRIRFIPAGLKRPIKRAAARLFPTRIG